MKKINTVLLLLVLSLAALYSEDQDTAAAVTNKALQLQMDDAVVLGLKNNLDFESEQLTLNKKKWAMYTSWNTFIPSMSLTSTISRANNREESSLGVEPDELNLGLGFSLSLSVSAKTFLQINSTVLDYKSGKIDLEDAKAQLTRDIKKSYYNLILLGKKIDLAKESLETEKKTYEQALVDYNHGLKTEYDLLSAQVSYETLKPDLITAEDNYESAVLSFKDVIGVRSDAEIDLTDEIEIIKKEFDSGELIDKYINNRYDIQKLNMGLNALENDKGVAISEFTPSFSLSFTSNPTLQYDLTVPNDWTYNLNDDWKDSTGSLALSVSLPIDTLIPFSSSQMDIVNSEIDIKKQKLAIRDGENSAKEEILQSVSTLNKSLKSQEILELSIKLAEKAYKLARDAYRAGTKDILNLQDAKTKFEKAKVNLLEEQINYLTTFIELEYQVNTDLK